MTTPDQRDESKLADAESAREVTQESEKIELLASQLHAANQRILKLESSNAALARQSLSLMSRVTTDDAADGATNASVISELRVRISTMERITRDLDVDLEKCEERCDRQRKELHSLNVEWRTTLTQLEDAQHALAILRADLSTRGEK